MIADFNKLITPAQVEIATAKIIGSFNDKPQELIVQIDYVIVRNFLMTSISMSNTNTTLQQFNEARIVDCQHVLSVDQHKTIACYGPVKTAPAPTLHSWMKIYILQLFAHRCQRPVKQNLFLYWNGDSLSSAQITVCRLYR